MKYFLPLILLISLPSFILGQGKIDKELRKFWKSHQTGLLQKFNGPIKPGDIKQLNYFPPNKRWRVRAKVEQSSEVQVLELPTSAGKIKQYSTYAYLQFQIDDIDFRLPVYQYVGMGQDPVLKDHLFLPFTDLTNGETTYGGGRYIDLYTSDIQDGSIVIDFNKAYNPYCAYADGWNCPIPPKANDMEIAVEAGEKEYTGIRRTRK